MVDKALTFLTAYLNEQLKLSFGVNEKLIIMGNPKLDDDTFENKITIALLNIEEETMVKPSVRRDSGVVEQKIPSQLNLQLLIASNFGESNYLEGLKLLSFLIKILRQNPVFAKQNFPNIEHPIERLMLENSNVSLAELSQIWLAMGANLSPSVVYKMRVLGGTDEMIERRITGFNQVL